MSRDKITPDVQASMVMAISRLGPDVVADVAGCSPREAFADACEEMALYCDHTDKPDLASEWRALAVAPCYRVLDLARRAKMVENGGKRPRNWWDDLFGFGDAR